ncbi:MAG: zinc ribbon domain-containing protein [Clostridia bacterium]|nr:zinc ribbon domain-containing protein [Clostridia bacterium]
MFCEKCGAKIKRGSRFCEKCGQKIEEKSSTNKKNIYIAVSVILILVCICAILLCIFNTKNKDVVISKDDIDISKNKSTKDAMSLNVDATLSESGAYLYVSEDEMINAIERCNKKYNYKLKYSKSESANMSFITYSKNNKDVILMSMYFNIFGVVDSIQINLEDEKNMEYLDNILQEATSSRLKECIIKSANELKECEYRFYENIYYFKAQNMLVIFPGDETAKDAFLDRLNDENNQEVLNPNKLSIKENPAK